MFVIWAAENRVDTPQPCETNVFENTGGVEA